MMRAEGEASSDFQEYTLVALLSLAAHLAGGAAAERAALPAMSRYFAQDLDVLQQAREPCSLIPWTRSILVSMSCSHLPAIFTDGL